MLLRIVIRINIVRCISVNKIEITVLSARVLDALSGRGLKAKTVHEFERYGTRRIVKHCLGKGQILYSKETVQNFVWQERAKQESGTLPHYQWGITRRAAVYLDQMAEYGKIQDEPIRPWEAEHNPLFQAISCNPSNSMKVIDIICRTRDAVMQLELSDKTKTNYIYCGFGAILNFFISRGEESYSPETLSLFEKTVQENFVNGAMQKASFQTMRKAAHWIEEYLSTGQVSQQKLRKYNFACAPPEFENRPSINQYTPEGRRKIHDMLCKEGYADVLFELGNRMSPLQSVEYCDNRLARFVASKGKCEITGKLLSVNEVHCHHFLPRHLGGTDQYSNLRIVHADVHRLIHATTPESIQFYLRKTGCYKKPCLDKINRWRASANLPAITL